MHAEHGCTVNSQCVVIYLVVSAVIALHITPCGLLQAFSLSVAASDRTASLDLAGLDCTHLVTADRRTAHNTVASMKIAFFVTHKQETSW